MDHLMQKYDPVKSQEELKACMRRAQQERSKRCRHEWYENLETYSMHCIKCGWTVSRSALDMMGIALPVRGLR
jgi:hypothetical protein